MQMKLTSGAWTGVNVYMTTTVPLGYKYILGLDNVDASKNVWFGMEDRHIAMYVEADVTLGVEELDFFAYFDPITKCWTAAWRWLE